MKPSILCSILASMVFVVIGCGMKGDLVLPNDPEFQNRAKFPDVLVPSQPSDPPSKR